MSGDTYASSGVNYQRLQEEVGRQQQQQQQQGQNKEMATISSSINGDANNGTTGPVRKKTTSLTLLYTWLKNCLQFQSAAETGTANPSSSSDVGFSSAVRIPPPPGSQSNQRRDDIMYFSID